jgi:hypothetical protein
MFHYVEMIFWYILVNPDTKTWDLSQEGDSVLRKAQEKSPFQAGKL